MDITTLKTTINNNVTGIDADQELNLAGDALESDTISQVFNTYLDGGALIIKTATVVEAPDSITIAGAGGNAIFSDMTVTARFTLQNEVAACLVTASPQENWSFASSFPQLKKTFLPLLELADATLLLASSDVSDTVKTGLSFKGSLQLSGQLSLIAWLLGGADLVDLSGRIDLKDDIPLITLAKKLGGVSLGFLELPFVVFAVSTNASQDPFSEVDAALNLSSEIAFQSTSIPISTTVFPYSRSANFAANLTSGLNSSLDGLTSLTNGVNLAGLLPDDLELSNQLSLQDLVFAVNLQTKTLESVAIEAASTQAWILVENAISIEKLRLKFRVDDITKPRKRPSMKLYGEIGLG